MLRFVFFVILFIGIAPMVMAQEISPPAPENIDAATLLQPNEDDIILGNPKANVTIVEYASLSCSHCAHFHKKSFVELKEHYIDTGKIRFIYRDFPLDEPALYGSMLARCAPKDRFFAFIDVLFETQHSWANKKNYIEILSNLAKLGGMSGETFDQCLQNDAIKNQVAMSKYLAANHLEIRSTPSLFINGTLYEGKRHFEALKNFIDPLLTEDDAPAKNNAL